MNIDSSLSAKYSGRTCKSTPAPKVAPESLENSGVLYPQMLTPHPRYFRIYPRCFFCLAALEQATEQ